MHTPLVYITRKPTVAITSTIIYYHIVCRPNNTDPGTSRKWKVQGNLVAATIMLNITDQVCYYQELLNDIKTFATRPPWVQLVFMLLMVSIFVVGVVGNLLTCIVIYCDKSMHTATNYYLFNLAISDLIMAFGILLEANVFSNYIDKFEGYDDTACRVHLFLIVALWNNSILIMTTLAVERYIAIWHPLLLDRRPVWSRVMRIMYVIWMIAIIEALPVMWTVRLIKNRTTTVCFILPTTFAKILNVILGLVTFIIPLGIMTFVYTMVALKVNITQRNCSRDKVFNHKNISRRVNKLVSK